MQQAHIFQINIAPNGGVPKQPIKEGDVVETGIVGDKQKNTRYHGGPVRAVCVYALETILDLQREGNPVFPGAVGENITTVGLDFDELAVGDRLQLGDAVILEITSYTSPCKHVKDYFKDGSFKRISQKLNPGDSRLYAQVLQGGHICVGDAIQVLKAHTVAQ